MKKNSPDILIFAPTDVGGVAEHIHYQVEALREAGLSVEMLTTRGFLEGREVSYPKREILFARGRRADSKLRRGLDFIYTQVFNQWRLAWEIVARRPKLVFYDTYVEYFAPLWVWPHILLARFGVAVYGNNLHDPVRTFGFGPKWFNRMCVFLAHQPFSFAMIHERLANRSEVPRHVRLHEVPVGIYSLDMQKCDAEAILRKFPLNDGMRVFLAFGFIRDDKNLDLFISQMPAHPAAFLLVVGRSQSSYNKPVSFYQDLARELGVDKRVYFHQDFVPDEEIASYFMATDFVLLTYGRSFRSQSGVLNIAARLRKPVLTSSGDGPLRTSVETYSLGAFVEPDSGPALAKGIERLLSSGEPVQSDWAGYELYASWLINVEPLVTTVESIRERANSSKKTGFV